MNIQTVITNLKNTIAGKEQYLAKLEQDRQSEDPHARMIAYPVSKMLELNIDELRKILADVEKCAEQSKEFSTWAHWQENPDRSGGQFTDEEIRRSGEWR